MVDVLENIKNGVYKNKVDFADRKLRKEYHEEENRLYAQFKNDLFEEFGVTGNPKAEKCFGLAWDHGHAYGYNEVYNYFSEFVELIK